MAVDDLTLTPWSTLAHKGLVGGADSRQSQVAPTWVPDAERTRLYAYFARQAYLDNCARLLLTDATPAERADHREYGDARLLVERLKAAVLGDGWSLQVVGASDRIPDLPDLPDLPDETDVPDGLPDGTADRITRARIEAWETAVATTVDDWEAAHRTQPALRARQAALDEWVDREHIRSGIDELETDAIGLGDGVLLLWPQEGDWPRIEVIDPAGYFPVHDVDDDGRFPRVVHLAWIEPDDDGDGGDRLRRITLELVPITSLHAGDGEWVDADGNPVDGPLLGEHERVVDGRVQRLYPWDQPDDDATAADEDAWSDLTCLLSDGTWPIDGIGEDATALDDDKARWRVRDLDLRCDFLPIIHQPNTPAGKDLWGRSSIDTIAQVLDDLSGADTIARAAVEYVRDPTIALKEGNLPDGAVMRPGRVFTGEMTVLDLAGGLREARDYRDDLLERAATNSRVTAEGLGRTDDTNLSGVALLLRLAPFAQVVAGARMVRAPKYGLLGRMAQRLAQVQGVLPAGPTPTVRMGWGSFMPVDPGQVAKMVADAVRAGVMSRRTAVTMLVAAGVPVDDAEAEVARIVTEDLTGTVALADALAGSPDVWGLIGERLGVEVTPPAAGGDVGVVRLPDDGDEQ